MQYKRPKDEQKDLVLLNNAEAEPQSQLDTDAHRQVAKDVPEPTPPEEQRTVSTPEKVMAASAPGSEYWLP